MMDFSYCKIEVYIPETHFAALQKALQEADAGHIGKYDSCLSYSKVMSTAIYWTSGGDQHRSGVEGGNGVPYRSSRSNRLCNQADTPL